MMSFLNNFFDFFRIAEQSGAQYDYEKQQMNVDLAAMQNMQFFAQQEHEAQQSRLARFMDDL